MEPGTRYGLIIVLAGMFEIIVTPAILKRYRNLMQPKQYEMVIRMTRRSGLIVVVFGLTLLLGFWGPR